MRIVFWSGAALAFTLSWVSHLSAAQDTSCLDQAQTQQEVDRCLDQIYNPLQNQIEDEFKRLAEKFKGHEYITDYVKEAKHAWQGYVYYQCIFEGEAAIRVDKNTKQVLAANEVPTNGLKSLEGSVAAWHCIIRTAQEMYAALAKL